MPLTLSALLGNGDPSFPCTQIQQYCEKRRVGAAEKPEVVGAPGALALPAPQVFLLVEMSRTACASAAF